MYTNAAKVHIRDQNHKQCYLRQKRYSLSMVSRKAVLQALSLFSGEAGCHRTLLFGQILQKIQRSRDREDYLSMQLHSGLNFGAWGCPQDDVLGFHQLGLLDGLLCRAETRRSWGDDRRLQNHIVPWSKALLHGGRA